MDALVASPPSPEKTVLSPAWPATVLIIPAVLILRMTDAARSEIYRFPTLSIVKPLGWNEALVALPPSPVYAFVPFPATVVITPWARQIIGTASASLQNVLGGVCQAAIE